jgi:hypothetical protein
MVPARPFSVAPTDQATGIGNDVNVAAHFNTDYLEVDRSAFAASAISKIAPVEIRP